MKVEEKKVLDVVANDVKWLVENLKATNEHLEKLNNNVAKNSIRSSSNEKAIGLQWKIFGGGFISLLIVIVLKVAGVY